MNDRNTRYSVISGVAESSQLTWIRLSPPTTAEAVGGHDDELAAALSKAKAPIRSRQPTLLVVGTYSLTYQKVQSSTGSMVIDV